MGAFPAPPIHKIVPVRAVIRPMSPGRQSVLIAAVCAAADVASVLDSPLAGTPARATACVLLIVLLDGALALPTRWSGWVAAAHAVAGVGVALAFGGGPHGGRGAGVAGTLIAAYRAGAWLTGWAAWSSLLVLCAGAFGVDLAAASHGGLPQDWTRMVIGAATNAALPWMVGRFTTMHRTYLDDLRHHRETERREAQAAVEKAVARERTAIARDLHDVISHHVSAIGMHAGAARLALAAPGGVRVVPGERSAVSGEGPVVPGEQRVVSGEGPVAESLVAESLAAVETASRSAMADLRKMLDVLHGAGDGAGQPGLDNLDELLDGVRRSGLPVRLTTHGPARPLPGSLDVALYRISQEMLTNARRHGDGGPVELSLTYAGDAVTLSARNDVGRPAVASGTARGLSGIRTRAAMFQGSVACGRTADGKWETTVTVPTTEVP